MKYSDNLINNYPELSYCKDTIDSISAAIINLHKCGGKVLICGNGGSASDSEHISGELLKGFMLKRSVDGEQKELLTQKLGDVYSVEKLQKGIPAIPLPSLISAGTAFSNDVDPELVFAQLVFSLGKQEDILLCLSTSGNSKNIVKAAKLAAAMGLITVALTGSSESELSRICDYTIRVPATETYRVQEYHLPIYHAICADVEDALFGK